VAGLLGGLLADLLRPLGDVRQDGHAVGQHLQESAAHEELGLLGPVPDVERSGLERREQGRMPGQDAELAFCSQGDEEGTALAVHLALEERALDAHHPKQDRH
jgi:hypothetical protein